MAEFRMPSLGADMEAGTLVEWLKHPGDMVRRGDIIAIVDTEKGAIEIEVFEDGAIESLRVEPGAKVPVGTVLATISGVASTRPAALTAGPVSPDERAQPAPTPPPSPAPAAPSRARPAAPAPIGATRISMAPRVRISPLARKLAAELGLDAAAIEGTGVQGAVTKEDVERAAAERPRGPGAQTLPPPPSAPPMRGRERDGRDRERNMRAAIASAMTRSKREIPHYYLSTTIDVGAALAWLRAENQRRPVTERMLPVALLIKAVALALREVPELNGHWIEGEFRRGAGIHVGFAISLRGGGLVAPALHDVDQMTLAGLMARLADLVARARGGALKSSELSDPTITVTNLGDQGVEATFGVIYPPQVALVGFGRIVERPWMVSGQVQARPLVTATLSADHRATDGHRGGMLLTAVDRLLQAPEKL